jgi:hypothetical protein
MGTVAQLPRSQDYAKVVLFAIQRHAQDRAVLGREPDLRQVCRLLRDAIEDPHRRDLVLLGLAEYLSAATSGILLNIQDWLPPSL